MTNKEWLAMKSRARNEVIAKFTETIHAFNKYIEEWPDSDERARLVGQHPELVGARYRFERATAADEEP